MITAVRTIDQTPPMGGCPGHTKTITNKAAWLKGAAPEYKEDHLTIDCPTCEPRLAVQRATFGSPANPPLTWDEQQAVSRHEHDAVTKGAAELAKAIGLAQANL